MTKFLGVMLFLSLATFISCQSNLYTSRYDGMDIDQILNNKRLLDAYIRCLLDTGRCTAEGREMKSHISEALQNGCAKCTDAQKAGSKRVIQHLITNENASWQSLVNKYDPNRIYTQQYEDELSQIIGI